MHNDTTETAGWQAWRLKSDSTQTTGSKLKKDGRPQLPSNPKAFSDLLWREIKRGPGGIEAVPLFAKVVAETIIRDYAISPELQKHFVLIGLTEAVRGKLEPDED